ncbi:extracellular solute-binding protein [Paenibacillus sp. GYB004]|uniref:ABC transporter substrate-binding protein n=1 Tax=Paenibacillus sp. GYB004 TaxID=2994393 RepID=UPI002F9671AB
MKKRVVSASVLAIAVLTAAAGCGGKEGGEQGQQVKPEVNKDPITLQLAVQGTGAVVDPEFQAIVNEHLKKKYPHITINYNPESQGTTIDALLAAGTPPDIIITFNGNLASYRDKELVYDMTPQFQTNGVDLGRFEATYINDVKNASDKGELYGLPVNVNYHAMYYNKDIFDKFGVAYPTNGMNWDQLLDTARKLTRKEGGTQYRGLDPGSTIIWMSQPLSIAVIDPKTDKAIINTDKWRRVFELAKSIYDIPGNGYIAESPKDQFMKSKTLAILLDLNILNQLASAEKEGLNWDVAQYPSYPEQPNTYGNASVYVAVGTKPSKYKDDVAKVIDLMSSEEVQLALSQKGRLSPLRSEKVKDALGSENPALKNKDLPSIFKSKPVPYPVASIYRSKAESAAVTIFRQYLNGGMDVNTALKQTEEAVNKLVEAEKGKQ